MRISDWSSDVCSSDLAHLRQFLPPALANHCALANVRDDTLVFLVSSPVWKAKLRLLADAVLAAANSAGVPARELTLKVASLPLPPPETTPHADRKSTRLNSSH